MPTQAEQAKELKTIEQKLSEILITDKRNWVTVYRLMKQVEVEELWRIENKSFTQWVKSFSLSRKVHESILWSRKKAGETYEKYEHICEQKGIKVPELENTSIAPESLELISKIANGGEDVLISLTDAARSGEMTRDKLREAYKVVRNNSTLARVNKENQNKIKTLEKEANKKRTSDERKEQIEAEKKELQDELNKSVKEQRQITLATKDIIIALSDNEWLKKLDVAQMAKDRKQSKYFSSAYDRLKYGVYTEFPVYVGTTNSRRIDMLVVENIVSEEQWHINLHGIEIKVSRSDLEKDHKFTEYMEFVDYMYLAVPKQLEQEALDYAPNIVGVLIIENENVKIARNPQRLNPLLRNKALETLILKLI